jgi:hypothetical protein
MRQTPAGRGRMIFTPAWSGQAVAAVVGRRLSELLGGISRERVKALKNSPDALPERSHEPAAV